MILATWEESNALLAGKKFCQESDDSFAAGPSQQATLARQFNGSSDFLQSDANLTAINNQKVLSIAFWLYQNAFDNNDEIAFESSTNFNGTVGAFLIDPNSGGFPGTFQFSVFTGSATYLDCTIPRPSAATWHHYLLHWDVTNAGGAATAFVDGVSQTVTIHGSSSATGFDGTHALFVMSRAGTSLFNAGRISSIAIWTADESANVSSLASCSVDVSTIDPTNLAYYWKIQQVSPETPTVGTPNLTVTGTTNVAGPC